ncbi:GNAT family N-acetyltransferase [Lewinella sp. IMCC34183]|uniref:GNAT family N-acetyltransferase n=1 Tax=Lewinella sp. IMCC34183 TaxID=2248762 RepID=UPI000E21FD83|nr:GNAT family N-acetyltransferase [Lewinella sp. IMCC34183]
MQLQDGYEFPPEFRQEGMRIWNREFPLLMAFDGPDEFDRYLANQVDPYFVFAHIDGHLVAWSMSYLRGGERWFVLVVGADFKSQGYGKVLMERMLTRDTPLNGWVIMDDDHLKSNGEYYLSPIPWYRRIGFLLTDEIDDLGGFRAQRVTG